MGNRQSRSAAGHPPASTTQEFENRLNDLEDRLVEKEALLIELRQSEPRSLKNALYWTYICSLLSCLLVLASMFLCKALGLPFIWSKMRNDDKRPNADESFSEPTMSAEEWGVRQRRPQPQGATSRLMLLISSGLPPHVSASVICASILVCSHFLAIFINSRTKAHFAKRRQEVEAEIEQIRDEARSKAEELRSITQFERARELISRLENVAVPGFTDRLLELARRVAGDQSMHIAASHAPQPPSLALSTKIGKYFGRLFDRIIAPVDYDSQCAIICRNCGQHNGLIPPLEYPGLQFRCCACGAHNVNSLETAPHGSVRHDQAGRTEFSWDLAQQENSCRTPQASSMSTIASASASSLSSSSSLERSESSQLGLSDGSNSIQTSQTDSEPSISLAEARKRKKNS